MYVLKTKKVKILCKQIHRSFTATKQLGFFKIFFIFGDKHELIAKKLIEKSKCLELQGKKPVCQKLTKKNMCSKCLELHEIGFKPNMYFCQGKNEKPV